jgi:hypothetical protein
MPEIRTASSRATRATGSEHSGQKTLSSFREPLITTTSRFSMVVLVRRVLFIPGSQARRISDMDRRRFYLRSCWRTERSPPLCSAPPTAALWMGSRHGESRAAALPPHFKGSLLRCCALLIMSAALKLSNRPLRLPAQSNDQEITAKTAWKSLKNPDKNLIEI